MMEYNLHLLPPSERPRARLIVRGEYPGTPENLMYTTIARYISGAAELIRRDAFAFLDWLQSVDPETGQRIHVMLYPNMTWAQVLKICGFDEPTTATWVEALARDPAVDPQDIAERIVKIRAEDMT